MDQGVRSQGEVATVELTGYWNVLRRRWFLLVNARASVAVTTLVMPTEYTASKRLFVRVLSGKSATDVSQGSMLLKDLLAIVSIAGLTTAVEPHPSADLKKVWRSVAHFEQ
jgi:capsular polysaccharide biosynthesis protein